MNNFSNNSSIYFNTDPVIVHIEVTLRRDYFDDYNLIWSFGDTVKYNGTCYDDEVEKLVQEIREAERAVSHCDDAEVLEVKVTPA